MLVSLEKHQSLQNTLSFQRMWVKLIGQSPGQLVYAVRILTGFLFFYFFLLCEGFCDIYFVLVKALVLYVLGDEFLS